MGCRCGWGLQLHKYIWDPATQGPFEENEVHEANEAKEAKDLEQSISGYSGDRDGPKKSCGAFERGDGLVRLHGDRRANTMAFQTFLCCMPATGSAHRSANGARSMTSLISSTGVARTARGCNSSTFRAIGGSAAYGQKNISVPRKMNWARLDRRGVRFP